MNKFKKFFYLLFSMIICLSFFSCSKESNELTEYCKMFNQLHPSGYSLNTTWYNFESFSSFSYKNGSKSISKIKFIGNIDFFDYSFNGKTDKFILETETIDYYENERFNKITTYDCLSDNVWYSEKIVFKNNNEQEKITKGRNDLSFVNISFAFDNSFFFPNKLKDVYENIYFKSNYSHILLFDEIDYEKKYTSSKLVEYFLNENYLTFNSVRRIETSEMQDAVTYTNEVYLTTAQQKNINPIQHYEITTHENGPEVFNSTL